MERLAPLALIAALALTGCAAGSQSADSRASTQALPKVAEPTATPSEAVYPTDKDGITVRPWEDIQIAGYLENNGTNSFQGRPEGTPQHATDSWRSSTKGELTIVVSNGDWEESHMEDYARSFMSFYGCSSDEIERVTVETIGGEVSATRTSC